MYEIEAIKRVNKPARQLTIEEMGDEIAHARGRAVQFAFKELFRANEVEELLLRKGYRVVRDGRLLTAWTEGDKPATPAMLDPWRDIISDWVAAPERRLRPVSTWEIATRALNEATPRSRTIMRIAAILRTMGYTSVRSGSKRVAQWAPPEPTKTK